MGVRVVITGIQESREKLDRLALFLSDLRPFWPRVVPLFIGWMARQFESEGTYLNGRRWAALSPEYRARKAVTHPSRTILIRDRDLRQAASRPHRFARPRTLTLTIRDPKAGFHQSGTPRMPARPLLPDTLPAAPVRELEIAAEGYVTELVDRLGL